MYMNSENPDQSAASNIEWFNRRTKALVKTASVAQLDAHPTDDQEVAGSTPAGSATFFRGD